MFWGGVRSRPLPWSVLFFMAFRCPETHYCVHYKHSISIVSLVIARPLDMAQGERMLSNRIVSSRASPPHLSFDGKYLATFT